MNWSIGFATLGVLCFVGLVLWALLKWPHKKAEEIDDTDRAGA